MAQDQKGETKVAADGDRPVCGVIMPISKTVNQDASYWSYVQTIIHRAISNAGFSPVNVWTNGKKDSVSERIVGNIFEFPLMIADISDLNPNVMFELGLRLASRKPTVVVTSQPNEIPFDIKNFYAIAYPADLNILEVEEFFRQIKRDLKDKYEAAQSNQYVPFLGNIVIDVLAPQERSVGINELILDRLDDLDRRIEKASEQAAISFVRSIPSDGAMHISILSGQTGRVFFTVPSKKVDEFKSSMVMFLPESSEPQYDYGNVTYVPLQISGIQNDKQFDAIKSRMHRLARSVGASIGIPDEVYKAHTW